jgi:prepilin-type N-terminal cleavage/methylation domain-containing protein
MKRSSAGFTLVEVLVAIVVLGFGIVGLVLALIHIGR